MANYPKPAPKSRHNANSNYKSGVRRQLREDRQIQAKVRQDIYDALTLEQKLAGLGATGSTKQRAKLTAAIEAKNASSSKSKKEKR
jgi:hypothetical protein